MTSCNESLKMAHFIADATLFLFRWHSLSPESSAWNIMLAASLSCVLCLLRSLTSRTARCTGCVLVRDWQGTQYSKGGQSHLQWAHKFSRYQSQCSDSGDRSL